MRTSWRLGVAAVVALGGSACRSAGTVPTVRLDPVDVTRTTPTELQPVAFLSGCWLGLSDNGVTVIEERWSPPSENFMIGTTRFMQDGRTTSFEFGHMHAEEGGGVVYTPYPSGNRSEHTFALTESSPGQAMFEAPDHDYPKRIRYRLTDGGGLRAQIDGGADDPEPRGWSLERVDCDG